MKKYLIYSLVLLVSFPVFAQEAVKEKPAENKEPYFTAYNPTYILFGNNTDQVKGQFSFKYELFDKYKLGLFIGYTQLFVWDVYNTSNSSPMRDINFNPEIFWAKSFNWSLFTTKVQLTPFEHKSNGRPADSSDRTVDMSGASIVNTLHLGKTDIFLSAKGLYMYNIGSLNPDIKQYIGAGEYLVGIKPFFTNSPVFFDKEEFSFGMIVGASGYVTKIYNFKFSTLLPYFTPKFYFQIYDGWAETLLAYNVHNTAYRFGIVLE